MRVLLFLCIFALLGFLGQIGKGEGPSRRAAQFVPNVPEECLRTGICENVPDYPEEHVAAIIEHLGNATDKYKLDELDTSEMMLRGRWPEEMELCESSLQYAIPQAAPDKDGNWHYILNLKNNPRQGFQVEICTGGSCGMNARVASGYETRCKQKYMLRQMAGLNPNGQMVEKPFKLPTCCSCVIGKKV